MRCSLAIFEPLAKPRPGCRISYELSFSTVEFVARAIALRSALLVGVLMLDPTTAAVLRAVLDEVCENVPRHEIGARAHVASKLLEAATRGDTSRFSLEQIGRAALCGAPTMWR